MTTGKREIRVEVNDEAGAERGKTGWPAAGVKADARVDAGTGAAKTGGAGKGAADAGGGTGSPAKTGVPSADEQQEAVARERDELAESVLRLRAEFDNYRKRANREIADARVCAQGDLLVDLLPVLDNLERALDAAEHHEEGKVLQGVRLTRDLFVRLLTQAGVEEVPGVGNGFDPEVHEAVSVQPSEVGEGLVAAVLERGYRQGAQVLRPARVVVSAGPGEGPAHK